MDEIPYDSDKPSLVDLCMFIELHNAGPFFLDPRGGSLSLTHVVVLHLLLVDFFVSQPTVFIETS